MSYDGSCKLRDGRAVYIPSWPVDVQIGNLTRAGEFLGTSNVLKIAEGNLPAIMVAIMESKDPEGTADFIKHIVCQARLAGDKLEPNKLDSMFEGELHIVVELCMLVIQKQYADFFAFGLAEAPSPSN